MKTLSHIIAIVWLAAACPALGFIINPFRFGTAPGVTDPSFASVVLLLHADGTNGSTTFADSSSAAHTVTAYGDAAVSTSSLKYGSGSAAFDGSGDYLESADSADWAFGSGDFTIEGWVYPASASATQTIISQWNTGGNASWYFGVGTGYGVYLNGGLVVAYSAWPSANNWHHFAITRSGVYVRLFINGTQAGSTANIGSGALYDSTASLRVGYDYAGNPYYSGKMDDIRIKKGVALYTTDFPAPTAAHPDS